LTQPAQWGYLEHFRNTEGEDMLPLYATRIEDFGQGDFVKVDCAACHHVALLTPRALLRAGLSAAAKVLARGESANSRSLFDRTGRDMTICSVKHA
jgi:hypothetical protein